MLFPFQEKASLPVKNLKPLKQWTLVLVAQATQVVELNFFPGFFDAGQTSPTRTLISSLYTHIYIYVLICINIYSY